MTNSLKMKMLYVVLGSVVAASSASAKVYLNSMCTMNANSSQKAIEGDQNKDKKFPLASISKIVTSLWAVEKLGPNYRFTTKLHVNKVGPDNYDVHIEGGRDPIFGRSAGYFLISELNRSGVDIKKIENLTFDENFLLEWGVEERGAIVGDTRYFKTIEDQAEAVKNSLLANFATAINKQAYNELRAQAASPKINVTMVANPTISIGRVEFLPKGSFRKSATTTTLIYRSAPLHTILKNMNNKSNNHIADVLYWNLGGTEEFKKYVNTAMALTTNEIDFNLGSGNNADYLYGGTEVYNRASCETMIKVLYRLNNLLGKEGLALSDVMAVATTDSESSVRSYGGAMEKSTVAKTGTVNRAKTLAGTVSTQNGTIYFVVLMNMDVLSEQNSATAQIKQKIINLIAKNGGPKKIQYDELLPLPFDAGSKLVNANTIATGNKN